MWLPRPLYELLPYLYVVLGLAAIGGATATGSVWGTALFVLGLVAVVLGVTIYMKRKSERLNKVQRKLRVEELIERPPD